MKNVVAAIAVLFFILPVQAEEETTVVEFVIEEGTGKGAWNTEETAIKVPMGGVIRIINEDTIRHRIHTNGAPCPHGPKMEPGEKWDCVVKREFSAKKKGPIYDHYYGPKAAVYIETFVPTKEGEKEPVEEKKTVEEEKNPVEY